MAEETRSRSSSRSRSDSNRPDHPVFGNHEKKPLSERQRFSTYLQVVNRARFLKGQLTVKPSPSAKRGIYSVVADELISTWQSAYVGPVMAKNSLLTKLDREVEKTIHRVRSAPPSKPEDFLSEMGKVFNIALCKCFVDKQTIEEIVPSNCVCNNKIVNLGCYAQQMFRTMEIFVSEEDKAEFGPMLNELEKSQTPSKSKPITPKISPEDDYKKKFYPTQQRPRPLAGAYNMSLEEKSVPEECVECRKP